MRKVYFLFLLPVAFFSCKLSRKNAVRLSLKDSLVSDYLHWADTSPMQDTNEWGYKVLKAYANNDTSFFKTWENTELLAEKQPNHWYDIVDTCVHQKALKDLRADEAYRFVYSKSFCDGVIDLTLSETGSNFKLQFIHYRHKVRLELQKETFQSLIVKEGEVQLTEKKWYEFESLLDSADFWGLKEDNGHYGLDGSTLVVEGYSKSGIGPQNLIHGNYVSRWAAENTQLYRLFQLALKFAAIREAPTNPKYKNLRLLLLGPCDWQPPDGFNKKE